MLGVLWTKSQQSQGQADCLSHGEPRETPATTYDPGEGHPGSSKFARLSSCRVGGSPSSLPGGSLASPPASQSVISLGNSQDLALQDGPWEQCSGWAVGSHPGWG